MKKISVLIILCVVLVSCNKEKQSFCVDAVVTWGDSPAADGLGWYLVVDSTRGISYIPTNLSDDFRASDLRVNVCLSRTNEKLNCLCNNPDYKYEITSIRKL